MFRRVEVAHEAASPEPGSGPTPAGNFVVDPPRPNLTGDLEAMLTSAPTFRTAVRGYDRLQVDNYVAWAESELDVARREADDLAARYGRCSADLEIARRLLARSPEGQEMTVLSERMGTMLRLAADEAAALTAAGAAEADRVLAEARAEADARLRKATEIKQLAVEAGDRMREEARLVRAEAAAELDRARAEARQLLREAARERTRMEEAALARVAALQEEMDELRRRQEHAHGSLRRLTEQIGEAIEVLGGNGPGDSGPGDSGPVDGGPRHLLAPAAQPAASPGGGVAVR